MIAGRTATPRGRAVLLGLATVAAIAIGFVVGLSGGGDSAQAEPAPPPEPTALSDDLAALRNAELIGPSVALRSEPVIGADVVAVADGVIGRTIEVLSPITQSGWYRVRQLASGQIITGWVFGAHVLPADGGWLVVEHRDGESGVITLFDDPEGGATTTENPTGALALVADTAGDRWQVVLPDGAAAWIDQATVRPRT